MRLIYGLVLITAIGGYYWLCKFAVTTAATNYGIPVMLAGVAVFILGCFCIARIIERHDAKAAAEPPEAEAEDS